MTLRTALVYLAVTTSLALARAQSPGGGLADLLEQAGGALNGTTQRESATGGSPQSSRAAAAPRPTARDGAPSREQILAASRRVRDVFAADVAAAKTPQQKSTLAQTMLSLAQDTQDDAECYVLLDGSRKIAVDAKDARTMDRAIQMLQVRFRLNLAKDRREALLGLAKTSPLDGLGYVVDALIADAEKLKQADRLDDATEVAKAAAAAVRRGKDPAKQRQVTGLLDDLKNRAKEQAVIQPWLDRLASNPNDAEATLELGKHRCFVEENWQVGLPLLAKSRDRALAKLAAIDLECGDAWEAHVKAADGWYAYHESLGSKQITAAASRARHHYEQALANAAGLDRAKISKRLEALAAMEGGGGGTWTVVFRSTDPAIWNTNTNNGFTNFAVPIDSLSENVRYVRIRRSNGEAVVMPIKKQQLTKEFYGPQYGWCGAGQRMKSDVLLGICDTTKKLVGTPGQIKIGITNAATFSGWGFGHAHQGGRTNMAWNGVPTPMEVLEISVLDRDLNAKEQRQLTLLQ
jgi:hypothetical protein